MYSGGPSSTTFTGVYDSVEQEYQYPSARQNAVIAFSDFYLSAADGDLTTDGLSISTQTGEATDITVGNAPSAVLNATMLNPNGLMETLTWGDGAVYIGAQTASATADTYSSLPCHVYVNSIHYGINSSGNARRGSTTYTLGGTPLAVIANSTGTDVLFITDTKIGRYNGSFSVVTTPTAAQAFMAAKFTDTDEPIGIALDAKGCPAVYNNVTANTKVTYDYVPMGIFDFSNVDAFGSVFTVEAYDKMTVFDADATDWINNLSFTGGKTVPQIIDALIATKFGMGYVIDANAVNTSSIVWSTNPVTSYSVTYRQIIRWLAEAMACNARMGRDGRVEFYCFDSTSVGTVTPHTIVNGTRTKYRNQVSAVSEAVCYNALGAGYASGTAGSTYYVVGNPFVDPSLDITILDNILSRVDDIPSYYPTTINVACSDPHIDTGDFITVEDRENGTTYLVPIMHQTLYWSGMCKAEFSATGNQVRAIPESMANSDLASVVDSNPSAVVNKIQAVGISADWITSGKLTVKDNSNNVIFNADISTKSVSIGGFDVYQDSIGTNTPGQTSASMRTSQGFSHREVDSVDDGWVYMRGAVGLYGEHSSGGDRQELHVYPETGITYSDTSTNKNVKIDTEEIHFEDDSNPSDYGTFSIFGVTCYEDSGNPQVNLNNGSEQTVLDTTGLAIDTSTMTTTVGSGLKQEQKGTGVYTQLGTAQLTFNDSNRSTSVRAYSLHHNAGNAETSYTIVLPAGSYLAIHSQYLIPTASAQGMQIISIGTSTANPASVVTTLSGSGSDLTATTGTRSQVTVGNSDGTSATLTWTVQGRGYRHLSIMRLY